MGFSRIEITHLVISVFTISLAFSVYNIFSFPVALFSVGIGFVFHELGHKWAAQRFGCIAEYRMWTGGLLLALVLAIVSGGHFVFAAPGAVYVFKEYLSRRENGIISLAGPLVNLGLAVFFLVLHGFVNPNSILGIITGVGAYVNIFLGMFNMLPIYPLDGSKVFYWRSDVWLFTFGIFLMMFMFFAF